jgi:hypothetical protein
MTVQDILEHPMSGDMSERTPREQFEMPNTDLKLEPRGVLDASGSNNEWADEERTITKVDLVCNAIPHFVLAVEGDDAEAKEEQADGDDSHGGWRAFAFSYNHSLQFRPGEDESDDPRDLGDINSSNVARKVAKYRMLVDQQQRTYVAPALVACEYSFNTEFPDSEDRCQMILGVGDGRFDDPDAFDKFIMSASPRKCIAFAAIGYGDAHRNFVAHLKEVSERNQYFTYAALTGTTDPFSLALDLRLLSGGAKTAA